MVPPNSQFRPEKALSPYAAAAVILALIVALKLYAYIATDSAAMLGSLIDTMGDIALSAITYFTIRFSLKPADENHRHGHGKVEGFSALLQACFLTGAAVFLLLETAHRALSPAVVSEHETGIAVSLIVIGLSVVIIFLQKRAYKAAPSLALKADHAHYKGDIFLNLAVIAAFAIDLAGNLPVAHIIIGAGIALYILYTARHIAGEAADMLMDKEIPRADRQKIIDIVIAHPNVFGLHDLRTRRSGMTLHISFDVELEPTLSLQEAHEIAHDLDLQILRIFPNAEILIHKDPVGKTDDPRHKVSGVHH